MDGLERLREPLGLVADLRRVEDAGVHAQEGHVARRQRPLGQEFDGLGAREAAQEVGVARPRTQEAVDLKGDHGPRVQPQRPCVLRKVGQQVL